MATNKNKRQITICFSEEEAYIYDAFKNRPGKTSVEMKRALRESLEEKTSSNQNSDEIVDTRVAKILATVMSGGNISFNATYNNQENNSQNTQNAVVEPEIEEQEPPMPDVPPHLMAMMKSSQIDFDEDEDEDDDIE